MCAELLVQAKEAEAEPAQSPGLWVRPTLSISISEMI